MDVRMKEDVQFCINLQNKLHECKDHKTHNKWNLNDFLALLFKSYNITFNLSCFLLVNMCELWKMSIKGRLML